MITAKEAREFTNNHEGISKELENIGKLIYDASKSGLYFIEISISHNARRVLEYNDYTIELIRNCNGIHYNISW